MLFNTLSNLIVFESMYYSIKSIPTNNLIKITINNKTKQSVRFTDKEEFIYNGKMYDIVRQKTEGNITIYYCLDDTKEDNLFANLNVSIKNNMDSNPVKDRAQQILKKITIPLFYEDNNEHYLTISCSYIHSTNSINQNYTFLDVLTPPPEVS